MKNILIVGGHDETFQHYHDLGFEYFVIQLRTSIGANLKSLTKKIYEVDNFSESTVFEKIGEILEHQNIDYIFSFTEDGLLPAARASEHFAIAGLDRKSCEICINKELMRQSLEDSEFAISNAVCRNARDVRSFFAVHPKGIVIKDPKGSGSENVFIVKSMPELRNVLDVLGDSFCMLVEEYVTGREVSVETLTLNSDHRVVAVTNKKLYAGSLAEEQHIISPENLDVNTYLALSEYCERLLKEIDYKHGPCHIEVMIDNGRFSLIEINNRVGGDYIGLLVELTTGVDLFREPLKFFSTDSGIYFSGEDRYLFACSHMFYEPLNIDLLNEVLGDVQVIRLVMGESNPTRVNMITNDDKIGLVVFASNDRDKFYTAVHNLNQLRIVRN